MEWNLKIIGILLILLALAHVFFPNYFKWSIDLKEITLINRQMMYVHTAFIALILFLMGLLCVTSGQELISTKLGNRINLGLTIFWSSRLFVQFFIYSPKLWRGKRLESIIHILFSLLWAYLSVFFLLLYLKGK
jgi:hypothetical protein